MTFDTARHFVSMLRGISSMSHQGPFLKMLRLMSERHAQFEQTCKAIGKRHAFVAVDGSSLSKDQGLCFEALDVKTQYTIFDFSISFPNLQRFDTPPAPIVD